MFNPEVYLEVKHCAHRKTIQVVHETLNKFKFTFQRERAFVHVFDIFRAHESVLVCFNTNKKFSYFKPYLFHFHHCQIHLVLVENKDIWELGCG